MGNTPVAVVDTTVLLNLMTPVVDGRSIAPSGDDPFKAVLTVYDVHVPDQVLGEVSATTGSGDLLAAAATAVLHAAHHLTTHSIDDDEPSHPYGLDAGESHGLKLANELAADMFVTDEFNSTNYLLISLALDDRNTLFTGPHVVCRLAKDGALDPGYVRGLLTYWVETKHWDRRYIDGLRSTYL